VYAKACAKARNNDTEPDCIGVCGWWCCGACGGFPVFPTYTRMKIKNQCDGAPGFCGNCVTAAATDIFWPCSGGPCYMAAYAYDGSSSERLM
jgi:hypothetical protein